ncbi:MAG: OmpP1/FadL family transporter [Saprospiraceae bacterium]
MRILLSLLVLSIASATLTGQTLDDALRFSENTAVGTARSLGTANSMSAIGADWTALQSNPAGLAAFRNNEVTVTIGGILTGTSNATLSAFTDQEVGSVMSTNDGSGFRAALPQIGLVFTREPIASRWTQINFGIGVSQTNRFEENIRFSGATPGSVSDWFLETVNYDLREDPPLLDPLPLNDLSDFNTGLAYDAQLLKRFPDGTYWTDYDEARLNNPGVEIPLQKTGSISRKGYNSSFDLSLGGNFEEKLLVGATLSLVNTSFEETNIYLEQDLDNLVDTFISLRFLQTNSHEGTGVNGKFGVIYRASQAFRIGLSYHSPSFISVSDQIVNSITYSYALSPGLSVPGEAQVTPTFEPFEYTFVTPSSYRASAAYVIGRRGFISIDAGYKNYPGAKFKIEIDRDAEEDLNSRINILTQAAIDARIGGELNMSPFKIRAGFEYFGAPVRGEDAAISFSGGVGFRQNRLSADLGYRISIRPDRVYRPYDVFFTDFPQPQVNYTPTISTMALTVGWKLMAKAYEEEQPSGKKRRGRRR